jgi:hypothetical protein
MGTIEQAVNGLIHLQFLFHQGRGILQGEGGHPDLPFFESSLKRLFQEPPEGCLRLIILFFFAPTRSQQTCFMQG